MPSLCTRGIRGSPRLGIGAAWCQDSLMGLAVSGFGRLGRAVVAGVWPAAFGFGLLSLLIARSHPGVTFGGSSWTAGLAELAAGWAVIGAACYVWRRGKRSGLSLAAAGVAWLFPEWDNPGAGAAVPGAVLQPAGARVQPVPAEPAARRWPAGPVRGAEPVGHPAGPGMDDNCRRAVRMAACAAGRPAAPGGRPSHRQRDRVPAAGLVRLRPQPVARPARRRPVRVPPVARPGGCAVRDRPGRGMVVAAGAAGPFRDGRADGRAGSIASPRRVARSAGTVPRRSGP